MSDLTQGDEGDGFFQGIGEKLGIVHDGNDKKHKKHENYEKIGMDGICILCSHAGLV